MLNFVPAMNNCCKSMQEVVNKNKSLTKNLTQLQKANRTKQYPGTPASTTKTGERSDLLAYRKKRTIINK